MSKEKSTSLINKTLENLVDIGYNWLKEIDDSPDNIKADLMKTKGKIAEKIVDLYRAIRNAEINKEL